MDFKSPRKMKDTMPKMGTGNSKNVVVQAGVVVLHVPWAIRCCVDGSYDWNSQYLYPSVIHKHFGDVATWEDLNFNQRVFVNDKIREMKLKGDVWVPKGAGYHGNPYG
jgi:hypothetical protein